VPVEVAGAAGDAAAGDRGDKSAVARDDLCDDGGGGAFTLFTPEGWRRPASGETVLVVHFHTIEWFTIQEHLRRGLRDPLVVFNAGQGSLVYKNAFSDPERFARLVRLVEGKLGVHVNVIDISSCSAGYGAVREIVKNPAYVKMIRRIVLADSIYGSWDEATTRPGATSKPARESIEPWFAFAHLAARGEKTLVITHSDVPTNYASTGACAAALMEEVGAKRVDMPRGSISATMDPEFPLVYRADLNGFHVWGYGGKDGQAHITHARHIADVWKALDAVGAQ
jgi:hypothetical protein